jgi:hypothetical protein
MSAVCALTGAGDLSGQLSIFPPLIMLGSKGLLNFTMNFITDLAAAAGDVKLFTSIAAGKPLEYIADMEQQSTATPPSSSSVYTVSLALQGPQLGSLSSSPGVRLFTVVVGNDSKATGATAQLELIAGMMRGLLIQTHYNKTYDNQIFHMLFTHTKCNCQSQDHP